MEFLAPISAPGSGGTAIKFLDVANFATGGSPITFLDPVSLTTPAEVELALGAHTEGQGFDGVTSATTDAIETTPGSTLIVVTTQAGGSGNVATATGVSDNYGNTYTPIGDSVMSTSGLRAWCCKDALGGAGHTATVSYNATDYPIVWFVEILGGDGLDVVAVATDAADPREVTLPTTTDAPELVFSAYTNSGAPSSYTVPDGYTMVGSNVDYAKFWTGALAYQRVETTGDYSAAWNTPGAPTSAGSQLIFSIKSRGLPPAMLEMGAYTFKGRYAYQSAENPASTPAINTQPSGSSILAISYINATDQAAPTDNYSNTWAAKGDAYGNTPYGDAWQIRAYVVEDAAGGDGHVFTVTKDAVPDDEMYLGIAEVKHAGKLLDWGHDYVENGTPNTTPELTVFSAAVLIGVWAGDGAVGPVVSVPAEWTLINDWSHWPDGFTSTQCCMAYRKVSAGTYSLEFTPDTAQGANLYLFAFGADAPQAMTLEGTLPDTTVGATYHGELTLGGDFTAPVTIDVESIPDWLTPTVSGVTVSLDGTAPATAGSVTFTPQATDSSATPQVATADEQTIVISDAPVSAGDAVLHATGSYGVTVSNGGLTLSTFDGGGGTTVESAAMVEASTANKYWEVHIDSWAANAGGTLGIGQYGYANSGPGNNYHEPPTSIGVAYNGSVYVNGGTTGTAKPFAAGDVVKFCLKNGALYMGTVAAGWTGDPDAETGAIRTGLSGDWGPAGGSGGPNTYTSTFNFGATAWSGTPPSGATGWSADGS